MKRLFSCTVLFLVSFCAFSQTAAVVPAGAGERASVLYGKALKMDTVQDAITYLKNNYTRCTENPEKKSILHATGTLQEQLGLYTDARDSYARAAAIGGSCAKDMVKITSESLVLDAVRCALNSGDYETADLYLNSPVRSTSNSNTKAMVELYSIWSSLCKVSAGDSESLDDSLALLKAYSVMESMISVRPQILYTLWHITGNGEYSRALETGYPNSPETAIVKGKGYIVSAPFWYFIPRKSSLN